MSRDAFADAHARYLARLPQLPAGPLPALFAVPDDHLPAHDDYDAWPAWGSGVLAYRRDPRELALATCGLTEPGVTALRKLAQPAPRNGHRTGAIHHTVRGSLTRDGFITTACKPDVHGPGAPDEALALTELGVIVARLLGHGLTGADGLPIRVPSGASSLLDCRTCGDPMPYAFVAWGLKDSWATVGDAECVHCAYAHAFLAAQGDTA